MFNNEIEYGVNDMMLFEVECECDDTWSVSGTYSFDVYANHDITADDVEEMIGTNRSGLWNVINIRNMTNDPCYDGANFTYVYKET